MKVVDLGALSGEIVLFGGAVSNRQALEALIAEAGGRRAVCTGDLVAYCGDPAGTVRRFRETGWPAIAGNVEQQIAEDAADCGCGFGEGTACDVMSGRWYAHAQAALDREARAWMAGLPDWIVFRHGQRRWAVVHGGATAINRFLWPVSDEAAFLEEVAELRRQVGDIDGVVAGHCGFAFQKEIDDVLWVNAGSIGMPPHRGRVETEFAVLGEDGVSLRSLSYDVAGAVADMEAAGLRQGYERALETGWWPSEDVLPGALRR